MILLTLVGCGADLPEGWEDAVPIADLVQHECAGNPYEDYDERVEVEFIEPVEVAYREAHFRCEQDVEAFARIDGTVLGVLVQPVDLHPNAVPDCDCLYDVTMRVAEFEGVPSEVGLWRRWDALNEPNAPVFIGSASAP